MKRFVTSSINYIKYVTRYLIPGLFIPLVAAAPLHEGNYKRFLLICAAMVLSFVLGRTIRYAASDEYIPAETIIAWSVVLIPIGALFALDMLTLYVAWTILVCGISFWSGIHAAHELHQQRRF